MMNESAIDREAQGLGERLREVADSFPSRAAAAEAAGVSPQQLHNWMSERNFPPLIAIARMAQAAGFNLTWIATGVMPRATVGPHSFDSEIRLAAVERAVFLLERGSVGGGSHVKEFSILRDLGDSVSDYFLAKETFTCAPDDASRRAAHLARTDAKNRCVRFLQDWRRIAPPKGT